MFSTITSNSAEVIAYRYTCKMGSSYSELRGFYVDFSFLANQNMKEVHHLLL